MKKHILVGLGSRGIQQADNAGGLLQFFLKAPRRNIGFVRKYRQVLIGFNRCTPIFGEEHDLWNYIDRQAAREPKLL